MIVKIRYFASLREIVGFSSQDLKVEEETSIIETYNQLSAQYNFPLASSEVKFAVNNEYVNGDFKLKENDEVVFIPPVAGG